MLVIRLYKLNYNLEYTRVLWKTKKKTKNKKNKLSLIITQLSLS